MSPVSVVITVITAENKEQSQAMSSKRFHVIFTGVLAPGVDKMTALSNLVLEMGLAENKAKALLDKQQVLLKRCDSEVDARRLADRFLQAGLYCVVDARSEGASSEAGADSILMSIFSKFSRSDEKK